MWQGFYKGMMFDNRHLVFNENRCNPLLAGLSWTTR